MGRHVAPSRASRRRERGPVPRQAPDSVPVTAVGGAAPPLPTVLIVAATVLAVAVVPAVVLGDVAGSQFAGTVTTDEPSGELASDNGVLPRPEQAGDPTDRVGLVVADPAAEADPRASEGTGEAGEVPAGGSGVGGSGVTGPADGVVVGGDDAGRPGGGDPEAGEPSGPPSDPSPTPTPEPGTGVEVDEGVLPDGGILAEGPLDVGGPTEVVTDVDLLVGPDVGDSDLGDPDVGDEVGQPGLGGPGLPFGGDGSDGSGGSDYGNPVGDSDLPASFLSNPQGPLQLVDFASSTGPL